MALLPLSVAFPAPPPAPPSPCVELMPPAEVVEVLPAASVNLAAIDFHPSVPRSPAAAARLTLAGSDVGRRDGVRHVVCQRQPAQQQLHRVARRDRRIKRDLEGRVDHLGDVVARRGTGIRPVASSGVPPVGAVVSTVAVTAAVVVVFPAVSVATR